jgi:predicted nucleotidyltransferase
MISNEVKEELINGLREILSDNLECIILYGSVARGDSSPDSDVDIALIVRTSLNNGIKDSFLHWNALMDIKHERVF